MEHESCSLTVKDHTYKIGLYLLRQREKNKCMQNYSSLIYIYREREHSLISSK